MVSDTRQASYMLQTLGNQKTHRSTVEKKIATKSGPEPEPDPEVGSGSRYSQAQARSDPTRARAFNLDPTRTTLTTRQGSDDDDVVGITRGTVATLHCGHSGHRLGDIHDGRAEFGAKYTQWVLDE
jgi:hypothetical protein